MKYIIAPTYSHFINYCFTNDIARKDALYVHDTYRLKGLDKNTEIIVLPGGHKNVDLNFVRYRFSNVKFSK